MFCQRRWRKVWGRWQRKYSKEEGRYIGNKRIEKRESIGVWFFLLGAQNFPSQCVELRWIPGETDYRTDRTRYSNLNEQSWFSNLNMIFWEVYRFRGSPYLVTTLYIILIRCQTVFQKMAFIAHFMKTYHNFLYNEKYIVDRSVGRISSS